ncbi:vomeronasal type-1 receptor 4-like [Tachyglossus aculeatus]|uniref:vomeronasal type-1 receptor 4-like n=1 Tax=Tachyglossus aculeatus TaxID=9261 RepID=UPI0018F4CB3D|nr:vomeronasal type-1 receptor 4-like [Tachyglossus aculeatus]
MNIGELSLAILLTVQAVLGASGNIVHLIFSIRSSLRPIDQIFAHLGLANTMVLLRKGIPETMEAWKMKHRDTVGYKILLYCYCVARGLSICTTCLLSMFQAVTLSPRTPRWAPIKDRAPRSAGLSCLLFWILSLLLDVTVLKYVIGPQNQTRIRSLFHLKFCLSASVSADVNLVNSVIFTLHDLLFIGLMSGSSVYMMLLLHRSNSVTLNVLLNTQYESPLVLNIHPVLSLVSSAVSLLLIINSNRRPFLRRLYEERESPAFCISLVSSGSRTPK